MLFSWNRGVFLEIFLYNVDNNYTYITDKTKETL